MKGKTTAIILSALLGGLGMDRFYLGYTGKILPSDVKFFDTYDEALAYDGRTVGLCKLCQKAENSQRKGK